MKTPPFVRGALALAASCALLLPVAVRAQDATPTVVLNPIPDQTVAVGRVRTIIPLDGVFGLAGVPDQVVRFYTSLGNVDVGLYPSVAPTTVANFLTYADSGSYINSFIHRSVQQAGLAILQGGGYYVDNDQVNTIATDPPVVNEPAISNVRSTIAMAKTSDPNSATSQWFFNVQDNSTALDDPNNSGGFTVFGAVITDGMVVVDALAALRTYNAGSPFNELPVLDSYAGGDIQFSDLVYVYNIARIPMVSPTGAEEALLDIHVIKNTNRKLLTCAVVGNKLRLNYKAGVKGRAVITVRATDTVGNVADTAFTVRVR